MIKTTKSSPKKKLKPPGPAKADHHIDMTQAHFGAKLINSLKTNRFAILKNHAIDTKLLDDMYREWKRFFDSQEKLTLFRTDEMDEGYVPTAMETAVGADGADMKEYFQGHINGVYPHFIDCVTTKKLVNSIVDLGVKIVSYIDDALPFKIKGQMQESLKDMLRGSDRHGFRVVHYPSIGPEVVLPRADSRTDICFLTLLSAATTDGLELQDSDGQWFRPKVGQDDILVLNADMLEMASGAYVKATKHRVVATSFERRKGSRFSFPIFIHPRREVELQPDVTAMQALRKRISQVGFNGHLLKE
jgi:isopenicillin N synthase-like dioxygenase